MRSATRRRLGGSLAVTTSLLGAMCVGLLVSVLAVGDVLAADPLSGLDVRPSNRTCVAGARPIAANGVKLDPVFSQLTTYRPFYLQQSLANPGRWYFGTRTGKLYSFLAPSGTPQLVLDVSDLVGALNYDNAYSPGGSEQWGLSSFALHPNFAKNGYIFLQINGRQAGETQVTSMVVRYTLARTAAGFGYTFDRSTKFMILSYKQTNPGVTHHFGHVAFGAGGLMFIGSGDGTENVPASRPLVRAQDCADLRGKILRINVNNSTPQNPYTIPPDNPYAGSATCRKEIFALGFRNPWRFSLDQATKELWVGDVGAGAWEEADLVVKGGNYGWPIYEGPTCSGSSAECARTDLLPPVDATAHGGQSAAAIGGFVYRGTAMPWLVGDYIYSIFPRSELIALRKQANGSYQRRTLLTGAPVFSSYFTDQSGEIYGITGHGPAPQIRKLVADVPQAAAVGVPLKLSQTGCFTAVAGQTSPRIVGGAIPFDPISPLWSDGAAKRRWVALPDGAKVTINADGDFTFPVGTVLIKEFSYLNKPFETRFMKRHTDGVWQGYTYAWRSDLSDADLVGEDGATRTIDNSAKTTIEWRYPSRGQCLECHTEAANYALGPEVLQLNNIRTTPYPATGRTGNQLATWAAIGLFDAPLPAPVRALPSLVNPRDSKYSNIQRARSFLHANCAGCHRPDGPTGKAIDLRFPTRIDATHLCNGVQTAGDRIYPGATILTPQKPSQSAVSLRIHARGLGQMPPLGRLLEDTADAAVIDGWINRADVCAVVADADGDGVPNNADNCRDAFNPTQADNDGDRFGNRCDGDWNGNLVADPGDRADLLKRIGTQFRSGPLWLDKYDLNSDGYINELDLAIFDSELANKRPGVSALRN